MLNARQFARAHLEKLRDEQAHLDPSPFGLARGFSLRQRMALASWLSFDRGDIQDLTPDLDAIIAGQLMLPGDVIANVIRDEARRMRKTWEQAKAAESPEQQEQET
jgi:hypothetical protein